MSDRLTWLVYASDLPKNEKAIAAAYANDADDFGRHIELSADYVSWKTGYSVRSVRRITGDLQEREVLVREGTGNGGKNLFRMDPEALPVRPPYMGGDTLSGGGDTLSPDQYIYRDGSEEDRPGPQKKTDPPYTGGGSAPHSRRFGNWKDYIPADVDGADHPAVRLYCSVTRFWIGVRLVPYVTRRLGDDPDRETLVRAWEMWCALGFRAENVKGVVDFYDQLLENPEWEPQPGERAGKERDADRAWSALLRDIEAGKTPQDKRTRAAAQKVGWSRLKGMRAGGDRRLRDAFIRAY